MTSEARPRDAERGPPALLLLHGFALDSRMWRPQVEAHANVIAIAYGVEYPGGFLQQQLAVGVDWRIGKLHDRDEFLDEVKFDEFWLHDFPLL